MFSYDIFQTILQELIAVIKFVELILNAVTIFAGYNSILPEAVFGKYAIDRRNIL